MINKILKRTTIILLMAAFSISGMISCIGGDDITGVGGSYSSGNTIVGSGSNLPILSTNIISTNTIGFPNPGGSGGGTITPEQPDFVDDNPKNYYRIRVPFGVGGDGYTNVSYKDTNTLRQLWFDQINRKAVNDGRVFAIRNKANNRDENNFQKKHTHEGHSAEDYYYFNENGDIVYKEDGNIIKKFMGAIITEYRDVSIRRGRKNILGTCDNREAIIDISWKLKGIYTVGAIYANTMTTEQARERYSWDATGGNPFKSGVFDFITFWHKVETFHGGAFCRNNIFERQYIKPGFIEVFVMCDYFWKLEPGYAAVHSYSAYHGIYNYWQEYKNHPGVYFTPENMPYMTNHNLYLGQKPETTNPWLNHTAEFTHYGEVRVWEYMFMPGHKDVSEIGRKATSR